MGESVRGSEAFDIVWLRPDGQEMDDQDWGVGFARSLAVFLNGDAIPSLDPQGNRVRGDSFYLMFNAHSDALPFRLPERPEIGDRWIRVLDTAEPRLQKGEEIPAGSTVRVDRRSLVVLCRA